MTAALDTLHFAHDLCYKLLCNQTRVPFIISDHPAVRYNQFLEQHSKTGISTGLAVRGFQLFLPLSPKHILVFFDQEVYKFGGRKPTSIRVDVTEEKDVRALNLIQTVSADECIYFNDEYSEAEVRKLVAAALKHHRAEQPVLREFKPANQFGGQQGMLLELSYATVRTGLRLRCASISPHAEKYLTTDGSIPYRNLAALVEYERRLIERNGIPPIQSGVFVPADGPASHLADPE